MDYIKKTIFRKLTATVVIGLIAVPSGATIIPTIVESKIEEAEDSEVLEKRFVLPNGSPNEQAVLIALQDIGIRDKIALSVIMGNIRQESRFHSNICEGGARVEYQHCYYGGYGLIQWTTPGRYKGLGEFASRYGGDPSNIHTQIRYMFSETEWKGIVESMKNEGQSMGYYMDKAYYWLGWGHHGARTDYSHDYASRLVLR